MARAMWTTVPSNGATCSPRVLPPPSLPYACDPACPLLVCFS